MIDHAWGREPVTIKEIKDYKAQSNGISSGQVLMRDYSFEEGRVVVKEMMDLLCLDLVEKGLVTHSVTLHVGYSNRLNVKSAHGTARLDMETNADIVLVPEVERLYNRIVNPKFPVRRFQLSCNHVIPEEYRQYNLFVDAGELERNRKLQQAVLEIKHKFGKNAVLKGMNLQDAATTQERNKQIGGHKSGC